MSEIKVDGLEEFEKLLQNMSLNIIDKRKAIKAGIKVIARNLEKDTPKGPTGILSKIKVSVKEKDLATEGVARSIAFYDVFQEYGTSEQKENLGYFERSVEQNKNNALDQVAEVIFKKMR